MHNRLRESNGRGFVLLVLLFVIRSGAWADDFTSDWPDDIDRTWIGSEYFANRLQDWRVRGGRVECLEAAARFPVRTLGLLTRSMSSGPESFEMTVRLGTVDEKSTLTPDAWAGFLIGAGSQDVDYRISAMVHHRAAADGGILVVVDGAGIVNLRDFSTPAGEGGLWSVGGPLKEGEAAIIEPAEREGSGFADGAAESVILRLAGQPDEGNGYRISITATGADTGQLLSRAVVRHVSPSLVDGAVALVSHRGPEGGSSGFWFDDWRLSGPKVETHHERAFGPVLAAQHTLSSRVLKLTAQMGPLGEMDHQSAELQINETGEWRRVATAEFEPDSCTFAFRVENWDATRDTPYRIAYRLRERGEPSYYQGMVRAEPREKKEFVLAAFTGHKIYTGGLQWNHYGIWFPHNELVAAVDYHEPDLLFFSGDQIYEGDLNPPDSRDGKAIHDYLYRWYRFLWAFRDTMRDTPSVCIPDDHDVYHGNIWGAGGKKAERMEGVTAQDSGGYRMPPQFVNAVHRTQTSHLPDPVDPEPIEQGISVYFTGLDYGGVSFAILGDRMFKSSPTIAVPEGNFINGWPQNPAFDPTTEAEAPDATLLGERQLAFLRNWAADWSNGVWMKVVLSQTIFTNVATIPEEATSGSVLPGVPILPRDEYLPDQKKAADADSNAWPPAGRDRALREIRKAFALHVAGDQHLGSTVQYGVDTWGDAGFALCVPSIGNTWPRRWFPPESGRNREPGAAFYTGDYLDGFGNPMTVYAVSNPFITGHEPSNLYDRAPGYGIVRFNRNTRHIRIECWPRWIDPSASDANQYDGWPITIHQLENYKPEPAGWLAPIRVEGIIDPVVQVVDEATDEIVHTLRIRGDEVQPRVFSNGPFTVRIGDPDTVGMRELHGLRPIDPETPPDAMIVRF